MVVIDHGDAHFSVYQHLMHDGALVHEGDVVAQGQLIGRSGNTGYSTEPHLHPFEVIRPPDPQPAGVLEAEGAAGRTPLHRASAPATYAHGSAPQCAARWMPSGTTA